MPAAALPGDNGEQLGLDIPQFQDLGLGPVLFRRVTYELLKAEMLVSATAVTAVVGSLGYDSAEVLFGNVLGVLVDGDLYEIEAVQGTQMFGVRYLYRLVLRGALKLLV
jgi:hypothetical protein